MRTVVDGAMTSEHDESYQVGGQAAGADDEHELGVRDVGRVEESSDGLKEDRNAESDKEDGVEEGTKDLGTEPLEKERCQWDETARNREFQEVVKRGESLRRRSTCRW